MVLKRGLVLGAVALGGILALAGIASASTKKKGGGGDGGPTDAGFGGPNKEQCQQWYDERVQKIDAISNLNHSISSLDQQIADYEAASGGFGTPEDLIAARQNAISQRNTLQARVNTLAVLMQDCE